MAGLSQMMRLKDFREGKMGEIIADRFLITRLDDFACLFMFIVGV